LSNKFEFPKHKELFQEGYYNEENEETTQFEDVLSSPLNDRFDRENPRYKGDAIEF